jgi:transposase
VGNGVGKPVRFFLTEGQAGDSPQAKSLMRGLRPKAWLGDKAYDSNEILARAQKTHAQAVIPPTAQRKVQREYDKELYKQRNQIERLFNRFKQFRRIATRYEKTARNYLAFVYFAAISIIL